MASIQAWRALIYVLLLGAVIHAQSTTNLHAGTPQAGRSNFSPCGTHGGLHHPMLDRLLVVVSFAWNVNKLIHLDMTLATVGAYPTHTDIVVVTNEPARLRLALSNMGHMHVLVWTQTTPPMDDVAKYMMTDANAGQPHKYPYVFPLLWLHRDVFDHFATRHNHTAYLYLEDDTKLRWRALVSWACDTAVLAPHGFSRGIYRTEIHPNTGNMVFLDQFTTINVATHPHPVVNVTSLAGGRLSGLGLGEDAAALVGNPEVAMHEGGVGEAVSSGTAVAGAGPLSDQMAAATVPGADLVASNYTGARRLLGPSTRDAHRPGFNTRTVAKHRPTSLPPPACRPHELYIQLNNPFQGMWAASRDQLATFMASPLWTKDTALTTNLRTLVGVPEEALIGEMADPEPWGYPERSNCMNLFINVPKGYLSNNVIPLTVDLKGRLGVSSLARVEHTRNGYAVDVESMFGKLAVVDLFPGGPTGEGLRASGNVYQGPAAPA